MKGNIKYKVVNDIEDIKQVVELQHLIWDADVVTTMPQIIAAIHNGGVVIGGYHLNNVIGFCYGFPCYKNGKIYFCSHMMGIHPEYRNLGIGNQLKFEQRAWAHSYGYKKIVWTYDPLETRNAYLNLCKLGGYVKTYIENYYGDMNDELNKGLPSDRFLVEWELDSNKTKKAIQSKAIEDEKWKKYTSLLKWGLTEDSLAYPVNINLIKDDTGYLIPVPKDNQEIKSKNIQLAKQWRLELRKVFQQAFSKGYVAVALKKSVEPVHYYVLERVEDTI